MGALHEAVEGRRWSDVREILRERPEEARAVDGQGRLPLHTAAQNRCEESDPFRHAAQEPIRYRVDRQLLCSSDRTSCKLSALPRPSAAHVLYVDTARAIHSRWSVLACCCGLGRFSPSTGCSSRRTHEVRSPPSPARPRYGAGHGSSCSVHPGTGCAVELTGGVGSVRGPPGILARDAAMSYTPVDYVRSHGRSTDPAAVQAVEAWAAIMEAAVQQSWGPLRARQMTEPANWVLSVAAECEAPPEVRDGLVAIGKLSRALSAKVRPSCADDSVARQNQHDATQSTVACVWR